MEIETEPFVLSAAIIRWLLTFLVISLGGLFIGLVVSFTAMGKSGISFFFYQLKKFGEEIVSLSPQRVIALTGLAIKESLRRKALWIFAVFALLFMFAGWFLGSNEFASAQPYVSFVLKVVYFLTLPLAILLSCWGLPADIKARSLHTVVTKPVRRSEVVLGRILGYSVVTSGVVLVMGVIGGVWIARTVPERAQEQLISRVPVYPAEIKFKDRFGSIREKGINVGDVWDYRGFIEGASKSRAIYKFRGLDLESYRAEDRPLRLEYSFEVFRSYKGDIGEDVLKGRATRAVGVQGQLGFIIPDDTDDIEDNVIVRYPPLPFEVEEFKEGATESILDIPLTVDSQTGLGEAKSYSLIDDIAFDSDGDGVNDAIDIEVRCVDRSQYLGAAQYDMFVREPDRSFNVGYTKAIGGILLMSLLLIIIGTTASTFVKGPVATLLTVGIFLLGDGRARGFADKYLSQFATDGKVSGGGAIESLVRSLTQQSIGVPLEDSAATTVIQTIDYGMLQSLSVLFNAIPDLRSFDMSQYVSKGFDVPFYDSFLPSLLTVIGFLIPCVVIGYFSLQLRELEAK